MLLSLDHAVWRDVLLNWLGSLREIVRLDFAVDVAEIKNQFRDVFAQLAFPLPVTVPVTKDLLVGLCGWMQLRKVYLYQMEVKEYFVEWEAVFSWCRNSLERLHISGTKSARYCQDTSHFLNMTSEFCHCLQELSLKNGRYQNGETLRTILRNNASTLAVLLLEYMNGDKTTVVNLDGISCPRLRVLSWDSEECGGLGAFLRRCPELSALSLNCGDQVPQSIVSALAESCPALKRLKLFYMPGLNSNSLLKIAHGNSQLEFLGISNREDNDPEFVVELMQALPNLHTFDATDDLIDESAWLKIAVRGLAPSLRVLDVFTEFTCTGFRQFTAAYPHLTGLQLEIGDVDIRNDNKTLFKHCGEMKHLILDERRPKDVVDALLESVALCCPDLQILELSHATQCNSWALQLVIDKCTHLKFLILYHRVRHEHLNIPPVVTLVVNGESPPLTQWMPAVDVAM